LRRRSRFSGRVPATGRREGWCDGGNRNDNWGDRRSLRWLLNVVLRDRTIGVPFILLNQRK
jgi:hypothetical protein